jgi:adenosine deaminase CECR1
MTKIHKNDLGDDAYPSKIPNDPTMSMKNGRRKAPEIKEATKIFASALDDENAIEEYAEKHARLLFEEAEDGWDRSVKSQDEAEQLAATIIREIREYERKVLFGNMASEALPGPETLDMGGQFLTNKERIENESKLYEIAREVPKGALLHLHFNAELDSKQLLKQARETENMYIRSTRPLLKGSDFQLTEIAFDVLDPSKVEPEVSLFSPDYPGDATNWSQDPSKWKVWMLWKHFREDFEKKFSMQDNNKVVRKKTQDCSEPGLAEKWLESKMVLSEKDVYARKQTVNG